MAINLVTQLQHQQIMEQLFGIKPKDIKKVVVETLPVTETPVIEPKNRGGRPKKAKKE